MKTANETRTGTDATRVDEVLCRPDLGLYAVASGEARPGGKSSAAIFIEALMSSYERSLAPVRSNPKVFWKAAGAFFGNAFKAASQAIRQSLDGREPNTSGTVVLIESGRGACAHVGRTRAYRLEEGKVVRLTEAHVAPENADPDRTVMAKTPTAVGRQDLGQTASLSVGGTMFRVRDGLRLVLVSEGVAGIVPGEELLDLSGDASTPEDLARLVTREAAHRQVTNPATALVLQMGDPPPPPEAKPEPARSATPPVSGEGAGRSASADSASTATARAMGASAEPAEEQIKPQDVPIFAGMTDAHVEELCSLGRRMDVGPRQLLVSEGQKPTRLYIVLTGSLVRTGQNDRIGPGELVGLEWFGGEGAVIKQSVVSMEQCIVLSYPPEGLVEALHSHPRLAMYFYRNALRLSWRTP